MKAALITGSCGLVGSESVDFLHKKKFRVLGVDNNLRKHFFGKDGDTSWIKKNLISKNKNYKHFNTDIRSYSKMKLIFKKYNKSIKLIIHSAAQPSHDWAKNDPETDFSINANGTLVLLKLFKKYCPNAVFIFLSTNKVYGDNPNRYNFIEKKSRFTLKKFNKYYKGFDESLSVDDCVHSFFGASKLAADTLVQEYGKNFKLKTVCFRAGCITGPNHSGAKLHGFLSFLIKQVINKKKYNIIGYKGKQVRDNIHSKDLINCFWEFFKKPKNGVVYNIGGGKFSNCSILEVINLVEKKLNIKVKKKYTKINRTGDHKYYITDLTKFKKNYTKWKQFYSLEKIVDELIESEIKK
tara:strand:- start:679 stop:1734 length:1056 start_codon:yes stop_codon:yes gene_type:complete